MDLKVDARELLTRVTHFQLVRGRERLLVHVHQVLAGSADARFIAIPNSVFVDSDRKFWGFGTSEQEALARCLEHIAGVPFDEIVNVQKASPPEESHPEPA